MRQGLGQNNSHASSGVVVVFAGVLLGCFVATTTFVAYRSSGGSYAPAETVVQLTPQNRRVQAGEKPLAAAVTPAIPTAAKPVPPASVNAPSSHRQYPLALPVDTETKCTPELFKQLNVTAQEEYIQTFSKHVKGWLRRINVVVAMGLMRAQTKACIVGSIGEIGVHHGAFSIALWKGALKTERKYAMDLFYDDRAPNVLANAKRYGFQPTDFEMITGDSRHLSVQTFLQRQAPAFRFFSVDGGHDYQVTLSDLNVAASLLAPGGIIAVDDYHNWEYPGIPEAMIDFLSVNRHIAPFLLIDLKLYLTTADYYDTYYALADKLPWGPCTIHTAPFPTEYMLRGWKLCTKATHAGFETSTLAEVADLTISHPAGSSKTA